LTGLVGLDDRSAVATARLIYTLRDTAVFRLGGLVRTGRARSQFGALGFVALALFDVQLTF
jgi:hypothetical protein